MGEENQQHMNYLVTGLIWPISKKRSACVTKVNMMK